MSGESYGPPPGGEAAGDAIDRTTNRKESVMDMPNPTPSQMDSPEFEAIWQTIKSWDVNVPEFYDGYCGANGSHVALILNALIAVNGAVSAR